MHPIAGRTRGSGKSRGAGTRVGPHRRLSTTRQRGIMRKSREIMHASTHLSPINTANKYTALSPFFYHNFDPSTFFFKLFYTIPPKSTTITTTSRKKWHAQTVLLHPFVKNSNPNTTIHSQAYRPISAPSPANVLSIGMTSKARLSPSSTCRIDQKRDICL